MSARPSRAARPAVPILRAAVLAALLPVLPGACSDGVTHPDTPADDVPAALLAARGGGAGGGGGLTVEVAPTSLELWADPAPATAGRTAALDVRVMNASMCVVQDQTVRFFTSDPDVAVVDRDGVVAGTGLGQAVITVKHGRTEIAVPVTVDDGVRTPVLILTVGETEDGPFVVVGEVRTPVDHLSPFDDSVDGLVTIEMDGVVVVSDDIEGGAPPVAFGVWSSFADFGSEFDLDPSPGTVHAVTITFHGDPPFYRPVSSSVQWTLADGMVRWLNGVRQ